MSAPPVRVMSNKEADIILSRGLLVTLWLC
jgi:hypothetical protein